MEQVKAIKGFELIERIGSGGFGVVYRANQTTVGREVAIKIILPHYANHPDFIRRFESEAQMIARLEHPFIVPLYDYWREPQGAFLVMRWLRGGNLRDALVNGPFEIESAAALIDQIASALALAHRNEIVNRDLKPANILLDEDGNSYLSDFGIAKDTTQAEGALTGTGMVLGSPDYLSPEQARSEPVTAQTDIYSMGVVLYEILTGHHPFPHMSSVERMYKHLNEPLPLIDTLPPGIADGINSVIQKATAKHPGQRYTDILELAADFRREADLSSRSPDSIVEQLTIREQEILQMITEGCSNKEIAEQLFITIGTVKWHIRQVYQKLHVRSRVQAIMRARELNLIFSDTTAESVSTDSTYITLPEPENPYKGLRAFQTADARDFFGREKLVQRLLQHLDGQTVLSRFLAVVGPSGSGKSSVVKAGLVPALWRGDLPGSNRWFVVDIIPGMHPLDELEIGLTKIAADQSSNLREHMDRDSRGLVRVAGLILPDDGSELVVIVDQFEEVFTLVEDEDKRTQFLDLLHTAVTDPRSRVRVIITLRADFYDRPLHYPKFGELVRTHMETVMPLSAEELEAVIVKPAARVGVSFEDGLIATIASDVHYQPGSLPLLQYALTELFEQRSNRSLTHLAYQTLGGAAGALARRAEELFHEQDAEGQKALRQLFLRLVTLGDGVEDTRRRVLRSEILSLAADEDQMDDIIDTYTAYRLLTLDHAPVSRRPTVEIAHEAVLREWKRLYTWLNESRHDIQQQRLLSTAANSWQQANRDPSYLLHGSRLEQFQTWATETTLALTHEENEFLNTSISTQRQQEESERERQAHELALAKEAAESARQAEASQRQAASRLRYLVLGLGIFLLVAVALSIFAFGKESEANDSRRAAEREAAVNHSLVLAANAREESEVGRGDAALLLALEAVALDEPPVDAKITLARVAFSVATRQVLVGHTGEVTAVAFSPDGRWLLSAGCTQDVPRESTCPKAALILWNLDTGTIEHQWAGHADWINALAFDTLPDPDGNFMAVSASADETLIAWDITTGQALTQFEGHNGTVNDVVFVPGQHTIISAADDGTARLWDATNGEVLQRLQGHTAKVNTVASSPDGLRAATASDDGLIIEWDIDPDSAAFGEAIQRFEGHSSRVGSAVYATNGTALISNSPDLSLRMWDTQTGKEIRQRVIGAWGGRLAISPDGHTIMFPIGDLYLWDIEIWRQDHLLREHTGTCWNAAFSADGTLAATAASDGTVRVWNIEAQEAIQRHDLGGPVFAVEANPKGGVVAGGAPPGDLSLLDPGSAQPIRTIAGPGLHIAPGAIAVDPGGHRALVGTLKLDSQVRVTRLTLWDLDSGEPIHDFPAQEFPWRSVAISPDGRLALAGTQDFSEDDLGGELVLLDLDTGQIVRKFDTKQDITSVRFSQDGKLALSGSCYSWNATLWNIEDSQLIRDFPDQPACILDTIFGADETTLITAGNDGSITEWDIATGDKVRQFIEHDGPVWRLALSPDKQLMASGSSDGSIILWDYQTGEVVRQLKGHTGWIFDVGFSPDGTRLYSGAADGTVREWQASDWQLDDLLAWVSDNRYIRDFTCEERAQFRIEPLCN